MIISRNNKGYLHNLQSRKGGQTKWKKEKYKQRFGEVEKVKKEEKKKKKPKKEKEREREREREKERKREERERKKESGREREKISKKESIWSGVKNHIKG